jgi:hypothetical protein
VRRRERRGRVVHTFATQAALNADLVRNQPVDGKATIVGPGLTAITVTSVANVTWGDPAERSPTPQQIAARIGGRLLQT